MRRYIKCSDLSTRSILSELCESNGYFLHEVVDTTHSTKIYIYCNLWGVDDDHLPQIVVDLVNLTPSVQVIMPSKPYDMDANQFEDFAYIVGCCKNLVNLLIQFDYNGLEADYVEDYE